MIPLWSESVEARIRAEAHSIDAQTYPTEVKFCTRCVVSNQRPRIVFNEDGVCSACLYAERKKRHIDWNVREQELRALLDRHRRTSGYDVIVPVSGGKDSAYVAHQLKHAYGMHPLCVKWAPFMYTNIGRSNLERFIQSGFDCLVMWPNGLIHRKLARLSLEYLGDPFQPFVFGQLCYPMYMAIRFDVPLVIFGENGEAEYGGDPSANDRPCWGFDDWERVYLKGSGAKRLVNIGRELGAITEAEARDVSAFYSLPAMPPDNRPEFHWLGYYKRWHPQANYYYAAQHMGFEPNPDGRSEGTYSKYASLDDKLDGLHYYMAHAKFGIGRCTSDAAHEIRDGDLNRDEAVALVRKYDGEYPQRHLAECLDYLGCDERHFRAVVDRFRPSHLWDGARLRHAVWDAQEAGDRAA